MVDIDWSERFRKSDKKCLVLAGTIREYHSWCRSRRRMDGVDAKYITKIDDARGLDSERWRLVLTGSYYNRKDLKEEEIEYLKAKFGWNGV